MAATFENDYATIVVDSNGQILKYMDRRSDANYCRRPSPFARVRKDGVSYAATKAKFADWAVDSEFGSSGVTAVLRVTAKRRYFVVEVVSVHPEQIDELAFVDIPLTLTGATDEPFAACALALNLKTNVRAIPQATSHLWAASYPRFGFAGAKVGLDRLSVRRASQRDAGSRHGRRRLAAFGDRRAVGAGRAEQLRLLPVRLRQPHRRDRRSLDRLWHRIWA